MKTDQIVDVNRVDKVTKIFFKWVKKKIPEKEIRKIVLLMSKDADAAAQEAGEVQNQLK